MKIWIFCFFLFICNFPASGQTFPNLKFNQLTVKDGLSTNAVKFIHEDRNGIIWIATTKGLNRYDGTGFKVFKHVDSDKYSIGNDAINKIAADTENYLWLGTMNGLSRFNPTTGKAINYFHEEDNQNSLASNSKCDPFFDHKGRLWLATGAGIQQFNYKKNIFTTYKLPGNDPLTNIFTSIKEDSEGRLWALNDLGIYLIDEKKEQLINFSPNGNSTINTSFYQSGDGTIYLGQVKKGLAKFIPEKALLIPVLKPSLNEPFAKIYDISEWRDNNLNNWLCIAATGGLILKDLKSNLSKTFSFQPLNSSSLQAFIVFHVAKDRQNRLWLATDNGINIIDPNLQNFENIALYQQLKLDNPKLFGLPTNVLITKDQYYITSYYQKGAYLFDKEWKLLKHFKRMPENSKSELSGNINNIYKDSVDNLWFSTDSGLVKKSGNSYRFYFPPNIDPEKVEDYAISKIYKRSDGLFWIRARKKGIYLFDPKNGKFLRQYKPDGKGIDGTVYSCYLAQQNILWVGATNGISRYVPSTFSFKKIVVKKEDGSIVKVTWITDITEDKENVIWAVSDMGLVKIDKRSDEGILLTKKSGLPENYLKRLMIDSVGNLWITSQQGIIKYDRKKTFVYFNVNNGLPVEYEGHGFFEFDRNSNLLMGSSGYVTRFNPYTVKTNAVKPMLTLLDLSADGKPVEFQVEDGKKEIVLEPGTHIFNIHFAISNYTAPNENNYYYKLGGGATQWQNVKNGDVALGNLPTGRYSLYLKGSNNDDIFSEEEHIMLYVLPHWYETLLFKILSFVFIISLTIFFVRKRIAIIRKESLLRQQLIESELKAIRAQMNPHFIYNVLNSIELYILENDSKTASLLVQKFAGLSRLILENSTQSLVPLDREWKALKLYSELEAMRFNYKFNFNFINNSDLDLDAVLVPPMLVQPLIENAVHHGLRNSAQEDGLVCIELSNTADHVILRIIDNGIGIVAAQQAKISNPIKQQSLGLKAIVERVAAINAANQHCLATFTIHEIKEEGRHGTIAILTLPVIVADFKLKDKS